MRILILSILFFAAITNVLAEEKELLPYPLEYKLEVYPSNIKFGDIVFTFVTVKNQGNLTLSIERNLWNTGYYDWMHSLWDTDMREQLYEWLSEDFFSQYSTTGQGKKNYWIERITVKIVPGEKLMVCFRPLWIPPYDLSGINAKKTIIKIKDRTHQIYPDINAVKLRLLVRTRVGTQRQPFLPLIDTGHGEIGEHNGIVPYYDKYMKEHGFITDIGLPLNTVTIHTRSKEIYELIHDWYCTIPCAPYVWSDGVLFQYYLFDRDSPVYDDSDIENYSNLPPEIKYFRKIKFTSEEYSACIKFGKQLNFRSDFILQRIKRSKELESELLKLPDSELSQNMKEFIKLRGYLVDIRFAENAEEEEKTFNNFVTFIDKSKDKELWIRFVDEIAFNSIVDTKYFSHEKVKNYRNRFAEKFSNKTKINKQQE